MQFDRLKRRDFISVLGGAAAAWPLAARAQPATMPLIGFLNGASPGTFAHLAAAFRRGLNEVGYIEGQNVAIEYRWAEGRVDQVPALAADLVRRQVTVLAVTGPRPRGFNPALTAEIPVVATFGGDPVRLGFIRSINRPGGNLTGASIFMVELEAKRLELLHELVPNARVIGVLIDPTISEADLQLREVETAARTIRQQVQIVNVSTESDIASAFAALVDMRASAVALAGNPFFNSKRVQLAALATRHALAAISEVREFAEAGGLTSYGPRIADVYRQVGVYTGRILKGEKPADLPVVQPSKFELVINLKTAKTLGLAIPPMLLVRADEVIE